MNHSTSIRHRLFEKWNRRCAYCDVALTIDSMTIDHIHPQSLGGGNKIYNLALSCKPCNSKKSSQLIGVFLKDDQYRMNSILKLSVVALPVASQPMASKPVAAKPVASQPVAAKPVASQPVVINSVVIEQVVVRQVVVERIVIERQDGRSCQDVARQVAVQVRDCCNEVFAQVEAGFGLH